MKKWHPWMGVVLVILAAALLRIHLLGTPLERDEGEYAYSGQLMLEGIPPYLLASNMKLPGTYAAYALIMAAFGQTITAIHLGLLLVNAATILMVYLVGRRLFGAPAGLAACAAYALLSVSEGVLGTQAHATHFVVLAAMAGLWMLFRHLETEQGWMLIVSGMLFGIAFLMKQHGILFGVFAAGYLAVTRRWNKLPMFVAGTAAPFALTCLLLWRAGVFSRFWFWTFTYAARYVSENSLQDGVDALVGAFHPILWQNAALWTLAAAGLLLAFLRRQFLLPALLLFSFAAVCPGLYFRPHYVVLMLPAVALLAGSLVRDRWSAAAFVVALLLSVITQREFLFRLSPTEISQQLYKQDPFVAAIPVSAYIRAHAAPDARIAVLASEPEIYFYAHRHSATSYLYIEPLVEAQEFAHHMQEDMISEIERNQPAYVVRFPIQETLTLGAEWHPDFADWWRDYGPQHYRTVAIADILDGGRIEYRWDAAAESYQPQSLYHLAVYRLK